MVIYVDSRVNTVDGRGTLMVDAPSRTRSAAVLNVRDSPAAVAVSLSKRVTDLVVAVVLLIFLSPLILMIALAVTRDSTGPAFALQKRTGLNGKIFTIYKFRTMMVMEDALGFAHPTRDETRVTKFGRFLRGSSLDELPQLYNVLKGDMSIVGPPTTRCRPGQSIRATCARLLGTFSRSPWLDRPCSGLWF
jgi:lipopolysaccharide/colanic/teichoic acid biosynthesis glycosyltransferase